MDYKEAYEATMESLYFQTRELTKVQRGEEINIIILDSLNAIINDFISQVDKIQGERKKEWEMRIKTLKETYNHIGAQYLEELHWRKKCFKLESENFKMAERIIELEKVIQTPELMNEFVKNMPDVKK